MLNYDKSIVGNHIFIICQINDNLYVDFCACQRKH